MQILGILEQFAKQTEENVQIKYSQRFTNTSANPSIVFCIVDRRELEFESVRILDI